MPGRRRARDTAGSKVEAGCAKCCAYCRFSPLASAVCYSAGIIVAATIFVYLAGAGFASAVDPKANGDGDCSNETSSTLYVRYLEYTGVIFMFLLVGVCMSCCVCCGCFCGVSNKLKIAAAILLIPTLILITIYVTWMAMGTYLVVLMDPNLRAKKVCRNILGYLILLYIYLVCLIVFLCIVLLWQCWGAVKGKSGPTFSNSTASSSRNAQSTGGGGLMGKGMSMMSPV